MCQSVHRCLSYYSLLCCIKKKICLSCYLCVNTASASKVGQFRPFLGEVKIPKRSADEYFSFQIQECGSTTLETTLDAFCERSFNLLDATNAAI